MKMIALLVVLILSGCNMSQTYFWECPEEIKTVDEALFFVANNIKYEPVVTRTHQLPDYTYLIKSGNCASMSGILVHLFIYELNIDAVLIECINKSNNLQHVVVESNGIYYESRTGKEIINFSDRYSTTGVFSYDSYIAECEN